MICDEQPNLGKEGYLTNKGVGAIDFPSKSALYTDFASNGRLVAADLC